MVFPTVLDRSTSVDGSVNTHTVTLPTSVNDLGLLVSAISIDGSEIPSTPTGWTSSLGATDNSVTLVVWHKIADGTEGGTTFTFSTGAKEYSSHRCWSIQSGSWDIDNIGIEISAADSGSSTTPDPPSLTPTWGARDTLWLALAGYDTDDPATGFPTNYTQTASLESGGGNSGTTLFYGERENNTATENPGSFTVGSSDGWVSFTVAIRPVSIAPLVVSASAAAMDLNAVNPSVVLGSLILSPTPASVYLNSVNPNTILGTITFTPTPTSVDLNTNDPNIKIVTKITPTPASIDLNSQNPIVINDVIFSPSAANVVMNSQNPITVLGSITITPTPSSVTLNSVDPDITFGTITIIPNPAAIDLNTNDPTTILGSIIITPTPAPVRLNSVDPTTSLGSITIIPNPARVVISTADGIYIGGLPVAKFTGVDKLTGVSSITFGV